MNQLEHDLVRALDAAAAAAPRPGPDFAATVRVRQRRRVRRRWATAGLAAVLCLVIGVVAAGYARPRITSQPAGPACGPPPSPAMTVPDVERLGPAGDVWSCAVHTLPATLPDGTRYEVAAVLGPGEYLVTGGSGLADPRENPSSGADGVGVYRPRSATVHWLSPPGSTGRVLSGPAVDGDSVVWETGDPEGLMRVWAASISAGTARAVAEYDSGHGVSWALEPARVAGDTVFWVAAREDSQPARAIWRAGVAAGAPVAVAGTDRYELVTGAWARPATRDGDMLVNLVTGRRLAVRYGGPAHDARMECTPWWCAGPGSTGAGYAMLPAGGGSGTTDLSQPYRLAAGGRVALTAGRDGGVVVWNPGTGAAGRLGARYSLPTVPVVDLAVLTTIPDGVHPVEVFDLRAVAA